MKSNYNRDELFDYLTARELGTLSEFETPDCLKQRYTKAWIAKRNFIDNWLKQVQNKQQNVASIYRTSLNSSSIVGKQVHVDLSIYQVYQFSRVYWKSTAHPKITG